MTQIQKTEHHKLIKINRRLKKAGRKAVMAKAQLEELELIISIIENERKEIIRGI